MLFRAVYLLFFLFAAVSGACPAAVLLQDTVPADFNNPEYQTALRQALYYQMCADSCRRVTEELTLSLSTVPESGKSGIRIAIRNSDAQAVAYQKKANEQFAEAGKYEEKPVNALASKTEPVSEKIPVLTTDISQKPDTNTIVEEFSIVSNSPYSAANPIPVDQALPDGVIYKIQLGAFGKPVPASTFKGLTPLSGEKLPNGATKYYAGLFRQYAKADDALRKIHEYGFKDAFIVSFHNQKAINLNRAKQIENK